MTPPSPVPAEPTASSAPERMRRELLRYQSVLLRLGAETEADFGSFIQRVLKADAGILGVDRVGFWRFEEDPNLIRCVTAYHSEEDSFAGGEICTEADCPKYFKALREELLIVSRNVYEDERTCEFIDSYFKPKHVDSLLDVPVWGHGRLWGVLCHEHTGGPRDWQPEEQTFALSMAQFVSMAVEREERRRLEQALRESEERYSLLAETATDFSLLLLDPEGRIRAGAERIRGFRPDELTGKPISLFYPSRDEEGGRVHRALRDALRSGRHEEIGWLLRKDGSKYWARVIVSPLFQDSGELRGFATITQDLTERRLAEENARLLQQTRREKDTQRLLARVSAIVTASLDVQQTLPEAAKAVVEEFADACALHVVDGSRGETPVCRVAVRDPRGWPVVEQVCDAFEEPEHRGPSLVDAIMKGRPTLLHSLEEADIQRLTLDEPTRELLRQLRPISVLIQPLRTRGKVLGAITFVRKGTARPFGAEDLTLAEELARRVAYAVDNARLFALARESIRVRDDFLSVAAHEFRTPLTSLKLQLQLVERTLREHQADPTAQDERRHVELALRQVMRLTSLVHELLEISRIAGGRLILHRAPVDLSALVGESVQLFAGEAERAGSALSLHVDANVVGRWDSDRIEQVIINLLSNAIRYGAGRPVEVSVRGGPEEAFLIVKDHGIGIAPEDQRRIFGRFERAASSRHFGGLGLGLFITQRIIQAHGGSIEVQSEAGRGSTFIVRLPRWPRTSETDEERLPLPEREAEAEPPPVH